MAKGLHEPLITEELFKVVQDRLNGKSAPHKAVNEDFPLRGSCFAHLEGKLSSDDFESVKKTIQEQLFLIDAEITALDSDRCTIEELMQQAKIRAVNLCAIWESGNVQTRQELCRTFFPDGMYYTVDSTFFEPRNLVIGQMFTEFFNNLSNVGVPDGI